MATTFCNAGPGKGKMPGKRGEQDVPKPGILPERRKHSNG
jgi:hypothetical protein